MGSTTESSSIVDGSYFTPSVISAGEADLDQCSIKWKKAWAVCEEQLSDVDRTFLSGIETFEDCKHSIEKLHSRPPLSTGASILPQLSSIISPLCHLVAMVAASSAKGIVQTSLVWGLFTLVVQTANQTKMLFEGTVEMLEDLGNDLKIFELQQDIFARHPEIGEELVDIFVEIIEFWGKQVRFLRNHKHTLPPSWSNFQSKFKTTLARIRRRAEQIKERARAAAQIHYSQADLIKELSSMGFLRTGPELTTFPCHNIPYPRNSKFSSRDQELARIKQHLDGAKNSGSFRSFALFGTGGIGKTQTALAYAYEQTDAGTAAVLWVDCETGLSLNSSFCDIAAILKLEGRSEDRQAEINRILVLSWLSKTDRSWLCIFDNIEDFDIVRKAWPKAGVGRVLATSRNHVAAFDPAADGMEIKVFDAEQASEMIMLHVGRDSYTDSEKEAARELATRLGGLALALVITSSQIRNRRMSIATFVTFYDKHSAKLNQQRVGTESWYKLSLATCWQTAFERFSANARRLMAVISFLAPDALPEDLFKPSNAATLPDGLEFCADEWDFSEAMQELISASVANRREDGTNMIYSHRLTQEEFRKFINEEERHQAFVDAIRLLHQAFPTYVQGTTMRPVWPQCERYIAHVLILCRRWQEAKYKPQHEDEFEPFLQLSKSCSWYLMESNNWSEEVELMETAMPLCEDKTGETYGVLANIRGGMEAERGHPEEAFKYTVPSLEIFKRVYGPNHIEVANVLNNYANIIFMENKEGGIERARKYYTEALRIFESQDETSRNKFLYIPHCNLMQIHRMTRDFDKMKYHAEECRRGAVALMGEESHYDGYVDLHIGNALFERGQLDEAEQYWKRALKIFLLENETSPVTNTAKLKLSMIDIQRGNYDAAIASLEAVLVIAKVNEPAKGDKGEVARIQRRLAEAYEKKGVMDKADKLKTEAEQMRKEIQGARYYELPDTDLSYAMMAWKGRW